MRRPRNSTTIRRDTVQPADVAIAAPALALAFIQLLAATGAGALPNPGDNQFWHQGSPGITLVGPESSDNFGWTVAAGDFNGDGYDDAAIGAPFEDVSGSGDNGLVHILYGSSAGLTSAGNLVWTLGAAAGDRAGQSLAVGDFDGDGYDDLAVGLPGRTVNAKIAAGQVRVFHGSASGLSPTVETTIDQDSIGGGSLPGTSDELGYSLATGDFNGDGYDELAIGAPFEDYLGATDAGWVHLLYGSSTGLLTSGDAFFYQGFVTVDGVPESADFFGYALAFGDLDGSGCDDLVIGVPGEDTGTGGVHVVWPEFTGNCPTAETDSVYFDMASLGHTSAIFDRMGDALVTGRFESDTLDEIGIGIPGWEHGSHVSSGTELLVRWDGTEFKSRGAAIHEDDQACGTALAEAQGLMIVGCPQESTARGRIHVDDWRFQYLMKSTHVWIDQDTPGMLDQKENVDEFGFSLASGDFDGDGHADLLIGIPSEDLDGPSQSAAGAVQVVYGTLIFLDDFEWGYLPGRWSSSVP